MWMEKLESGVLRVMTPLGPRYIQPSFRQRVYLLWMFRHFDTLPQIVLNQRQQSLVDSLCAGQRFVSFCSHHEAGEAPILGTVERRPVVTLEAERTPSETTATVSPLAADLRQHS